MLQCHYSNVGSGLITSTPISNGNSQFNCTGYVVFPPAQIVVHQPVCRTCGSQILFNYIYCFLTYIEFCFLAGAVFQYLIRLWKDAGCGGNPFWPSKTTLSLSKIVRYWSVWGTRLFYWSNVFPCFYPVFFISYTYLAQKLHEMNTPCTKIPPILCHFCLL